MKIWNTHFNEGRQFTWLATYKMGKLTNHLASETPIPFISRSNAKIRQRKKIIIKKSRPLFSRHSHPSLQFLLFQNPPSPNRDFLGDLRIYTKNMYVLFYFSLSVLTWSYVCANTNVYTYVLQKSKRLIYLFILIQYGSVFARSYFCYSVYILRGVFFYQILDF